LANKLQYERFNKIPIFTLSAKSAEFAKNGAINFSISSFHPLFAINPYKLNPKKCLNGLNWVEDRSYDQSISLVGDRKDGFESL
jgi:hypothetical protein